MRTAAASTWTPSHDQAGDEAVAAERGPDRPRVAVAERPHRVEQVGDVRGAERRRPGGTPRSWRRCGRWRRRPRRLDEPWRSRPPAPGPLGRQRHHGDAGLPRDHPSMTVRAGSTTYSAGWAPRRSGEMHRTLEVQAERDGGAGRHGDAGPGRATPPPAGRPARSPRVGRKAVTPWATRSAASSPMRSGADVTSTPAPPLTCRSMKPGTIHPPAASTTGRRPPAAGPPTADGGDAPAVDRRRRPSSMTPSGVTTRPPDDGDPRLGHGSDAPGRQHGAQAADGHAGRAPAAPAGPAASRPASATLPRAGPARPRGRRANPGRSRHAAADGDDVDVERHHARAARSRPPRRPRRRRAGSAPATRPEPIASAHPL